MQELMIGNYVKHVQYDQTYKVIELDYRGMVYLENIDKEGIEGYDCLLKSIIPLPITIDWLVKNGFEKRREDILDYYYYSKEIGNGLYKILIQCSDSDAGVGYFTLYFNNNKCQTSGYADIQYIHQLQNLLNILNIKEEFIV